MQLTLVGRCVFTHSYIGSRTWFSNILAGALAGLIGTCWTMTATLIETKAVAIAGLHSVFKIPQEDICVVDNKTFICMRPSSAGLVALITESNPLAPFPLPKNFSLTTSSGLRMIKEIRNEAQRESLQSQPGGCNLFESVPKKIKKTHTTLHELRKTREDKVQMTCTVPWMEDAIELCTLRPVQARDSLWVEFDAKQIGFVVRMIREAGFEEIAKKQDVELPKGMQRKGSGFLVRWKVTVGANKLRHKSFPHDDMDEAVRFNAMDNEEKDAYLEAIDKEAKAAAAAASDGVEEEKEASDDLASAASGEEENEASDVMEAASGDDDKEASDGMAAASDGVVGDAVGAGDSEGLAGENESEAEEDEPIVAPVHDDRYYIPDRWVFGGPQ